MEEFLFILLILALAMLIGSTIGFGDSLILIPLVAIFLDIRTAIVLAGFWSIFLSILNAIKYRNNIDKSFVKKHVGFGILGAIIGSLLIVIAPLQWLEIFMAVFIMVYVITKIREMRKIKAIKEENIELLNSTIDPVKSIPNFFIYSGGFSYGLLSGLIGAAGPINVALLERTGHEREEFIGTFAIISVIIGTIKTGIYLGKNLFPIELLVVYLLGFIVIFVMTRIGHWLTPKIPKEKFKIIVLLLLIVISIRLVLSTLL